MYFSQRPDLVAFLPVWMTVLRIVEQRPHSERSGRGVVVFDLISYVEARARIGTYLIYCVAEDRGIGLGRTSETGNS